MIVSARCIPMSNGGRMQFEVSHDSRNNATEAADADDDWLGSPLELQPRSFSASHFLPLGHWRDGTRPHASTFGQTTQVRTASFSLCSSRTERSIRTLR